MNRKLILTAAALCLASAATPAFAGRLYIPGGSHPSSSGGSTKVPEPGALALLGMGLIGLGVARRRRSKG